MIRKCIVSVSFLLLPFIHLFSQNVIREGYKGYVEFGCDIKLIGLERSKFNLLITQGFQIKPFLYLGIGGGTYFNSQSETKWSYPVYADLRYTFGLNYSVPFFFDVQTGSSIGNNKLYISPSLGTRVALNETMGMNVSLGYTFICIKNPKRYSNKGNRGFFLKLGYDF